MFNLIGLSEKAGSGFDVLRQAAAWAHVEVPSLSEASEPDRVLLVIHISDKPNVGNHVGNVGNHVGNVGNAGGEIADYGVEGKVELTHTEKAALAEMRANSNATSKEIAAAIGISVRQVERARKALCEAGIIRRIGGTRGYWEIGQQHIS